VQTAIRDVISTILQEIPGVPLEDTVDTFKSGDPSQAVTGIVTTFLASYEVIQRTAQLGANLIITHEPTYYLHRDEVDWLEGDPVYRAKRQLIDDSGIVIWRFHDYWHRHRPDGILTGLVRALGWEEYASSEPRLYHIPTTTLGDLALSLKERLGVEMVRAVGDLGMPCSRAVLMTGAAGGMRQIRALRQNDADVAICGEINEWETPEYVRDAVAQGRRKGLIVVGHGNGEEPGMAWLAEWLRPRFPDIPITYVPTGDPFHFL
jgi:putative NIF3 family GTP cyclohydrolase 1 type 2